MGTLAKHIKELADLVGAVAQEGTATAGAAGYIRDTMLIQADDTWNDHRVYIYEGTGAGQERMVSDFAAATDELDVTPNWSTNPDTTSKYILLKKEWTVNTLRSSFILALRQRRKYLLVPKVDESITLDLDPTPTYEYNVPTGFVSIVEIRREDGVGAGTYNLVLPYETWNIVKDSTRKIVFDAPLQESYAFLQHNYKLRIIGQAYETEPSSDTSTISVATGNLLELAASIACGVQGSHDIQHTGQYLELAKHHRDIAEATKYSDIVTPYAGSYVVEDE